MAVNLYKRSVLIGGAADSLDVIDGAGLNDGDFALVMTSSNICYVYILNATSGAAESSPNVISPDTNAGTKRWLLQDTAATTGIFTDLTDGYVPYHVNDTSGLQNSNIYTDATKVLIGDTADTNVTQGLTINQGANDDQIVSLKSSDIAHTVTTDTETDTYGLLKKYSATAGGLLIRGVTDVTSDGGLVLEGIIGATDPTDTHSSLILIGSKQSGTTTAALAAAETVMVFKNRTTNMFTFLGNGSVILGTSTAVGTSGAKVMLIDSGTAPTTSPADAAQLWVADEGDRAGYAAFHTRNEAGQLGAIAIQAPLNNLLPNTQWIANSGSTVCEVTSGAAPVTSGANAALVNNLITNGGIDSATTGWTGINCTIASVAGGETGNCLELTRTGGSSQYARYSISGLTVGKLYYWSAYFKSGTSGDEAYEISISNMLGTYDVTGTSSGSWVQRTGTAEATATSCTLDLYKSTVTAGTMLFDTICFYEITPGYVAADTLAPDGWEKETTLDIWREHDGANTKDGSFYAIKAISTNPAEYFVWPDDYTVEPFLSKFAGRTVTLGCWIKTSTASHVRLNIYDSVNSNRYSSYHTGGGAYEWLEVTATIASASTSTNFGLSFNAAGTAYLSQPMLVLGSSIGSGNYAPAPGEEIFLQTPFNLTSYTSTTSAVDGTINLEAQSDGKIGKGIKAVKVKCWGKDSAAGDDVGFDLESASDKGDGPTVATSVNNVRAYAHDWCACDANGDIYIDHRGSGAAALTLNISITGVRT